MASITKDRKTGRYFLQYHGGLDGKRKTLRLGKATRKQADTARRNIEELLACRRTGTAPQPSVQEWLVGLPVRMRRTLQKHGLVEDSVQTCPKLGEWLNAYLHTRKDVKPGTKTFFGHTKRNLVSFFGRERRLNDITPGDADEFRVHLLVREGLSESTARRRLRLAKQFFTAAIRKRLIDSNPFADIRAGDVANPSRFQFVTREEAKAVLDACPDVEWRLIFALCRYGGLRCPSEVLRLKWEDVNWGKDRFIVHASKTEHHADGGIRTVPIFPELRPRLMDAFERAEPGTFYCVARYRDPKTNLRTQLTKIIRRAGLEPWPKLFQNLRSTRETELAQEFPIHVVCKWIGNTQAVAMKHYLQVTDEHFDQATRKALPKALQQLPATGGDWPNAQSDDIQKLAEFWPFPPISLPCGQGGEPIDGPGWIRTNDLALIRGAL